MAAEETGELEDLLRVLFQSHHFDFSGYKRATLVRRVQRRMDLLGITTFGDYADYLEVHPDEFALLFNTILINVTTFFRDPPAWEYLQTEVIPRIVAAKPGDDPIRVWSAGCSSGEEAYSLAIVLGEALDLDTLRDRLDLLVARNTLMYLTVESQARIFARLHYALNDDGFLFLGKAEMLLAHTGLFTPLELKHRIFSKIPKVNARERLLVLAQAGSREAADNLDRLAGLPESAADATPIAQVIVDMEGNVVQVNEPARTMFDLSVRDIGHPLQDLTMSYRPVELRSRIDEAHEQGRPVLLQNVERMLPGDGVQFLASTSPPCWATTARRSARASRSPT